MNKNQAKIIALLLLVCFLFFVKFYFIFVRLVFVFRRLTIELDNLKNGLIKDEKHYQIIWTNIRRGASRTN